MRKFLNILLLFVNIFIFSCASTSGNKKQSPDIKYATTPEQEYIFINGQNNIDYSLSSLNNKISIDLDGFDTSDFDTTRLSQESNNINHAETFLTKKGSSLSLDLGQGMGFKVLKRENGLVLALGKNYTPVSDSDLKYLETDVAKSIKIERDIDSLVNELGTTKTLVEAGLPDDRLRKLQAEINRDRKIDRDLSDLSYEQDLVDQNISKSSIVGFLKLVRGVKKSRLIIQGTKPFVYVKNDRETKSYKITFDFHNTYIPLELSKVVEKIPSFGPILKMAFYQHKWDNFNLARLVLFLNTPLDLKVISVGNIAYIDMPNRVKARSRRLSNLLARNMLPENNLNGYLGNTKKYYGKKVSIEVYDAKVSDVLRLLQRASKMNFVISDNVNSKISLSLVKVPWDQVLDVVMQNAQLAYVKEGSVLRITPLTHMRDERLMASQAVEATERLEPLNVLVYNASFVNPEILKSKVIALITSRGRMSIGHDRVLVVHDTQSSLFKIKSFLESYRSVILGKR